MSREYDGLTDKELLELAKQTIGDWDRLPRESILERAEKSAAYDVMVRELSRRLANRAAVERGMPEEP